MPLNHYLTLGRSGLRVSPLCLGTMTFGMDWDWGATPDDSKAILAKFLDAGGNFIDTANIYTKGHSEKIIGDYFVSKGPVARDRAVIATKFCGNMHAGDPNGGGMSRRSMIRACEESLRRLQTDYIDLYWMHFLDPHTPLEELLRAFDDLVTSGKVRYVGLSDTPAWVCARAQTICEFRDYAPLIGLQIEYSLLERTVEHDLIPMARELGMGVTPWSPLKGGLLSGKYRRDQKPSTDDAKRDWVGNQLNDRAYDIIDALIAVAEEMDASPAAVALKWVMEQPGVSSTIIGARTMAQLESNLEAADLTLSDAHRGALDDASRPEGIFPGKFLERIPTVVQGGTTVNGTPADPWPMAPKSEDERWT